LVTEAHACEQLAQGCYPEADQQRFEPATFRIARERSKQATDHYNIVYNHNVLMLSSYNYACFTHGLINIQYG